MRRHQTSSPENHGQDWDAPYALCAGAIENNRTASYKLAARSSLRRAIQGFTLIEVMIAMFVFFIVVFAILGVVVQSLGAARALQVDRPPAGMVAGMLTLSNCCDEGVDGGDFEDVFPNHRWERQFMEVGTNAGGLSLWQVDIAVFEKTPSKKEVAETLSMIMARPPCTRRR